VCVTEESLPITSVVRVGGFFFSFSLFFCSIIFLWKVNGWREAELRGKHKCVCLCVCVCVVETNALGECRQQEWEHLSSPRGDPPRSSRGRAAHTGSLNAAPGSPRLLEALKKYIYYGNVSSRDAKWVLDAAQPQSRSRSWPWWWPRCCWRAPRNVTWVLHRLDSC